MRTEDVMKETVVAIAALMTLCLAALHAIAKSGSRYAALASVIVALLMSYQWGRAAEPPIVKVIRLHPVIPLN